MSAPWTRRTCRRYSSAGPTSTTAKAASSWRSRSSFTMNHTLISASTAFIPTMGHTSMIALKTSRITQAIRFSVRNRSTPAWRSENTSRALPPQPRMSSQWSPSQFTAAGYWAGPGDFASGSPAGPRGPVSVETEGERRLEVVAGVGAERDVGLGRSDAWHLVEPVGDDRGDVLVVADPDQRDQVDLTRHRVDLADALDRGDGLCDLRDAGDVGLDEDDGGDHGHTLSARLVDRSEVTPLLERHQREPGLVDRIVQREVPGR